MKTRLYLIFVLAIILHLTWGSFLLFTKEPANTTPVHQTVGIFGVTAAAIIYLFAASCAIIALILKSREAYWFLLPQQAIILASTAGALYAIETQHYADGVARPWTFILADQLPILLLAIFHTIAVFIVAVQAERGTDG